MFARITKIWIIVAVCLFACTTLGFAEVISPDSKISEVAVYNGSARVTRVTNINLPAGEHSVEFKNILPEIDENSLTVSGQGKAAVKIFGAYLKRTHLKEAADNRIKKLENEIEQVKDKIQVSQNDTIILNKEEQFLDSIKFYAGQQITKDLIMQMPSVEELESLSGFLTSRRNAINTKKEEVRILIRELKKELDVLHRKLAELRGSQTKVERSIVVDLDCEKPGKFDLAISYLVYGASWRPVYDARVQYDAAEVELASYGIVTQTTKEDWKDVKLTLSTAKPSVGGRMPYVSPWTLHAYQERKNKRASWGGLGSPLRKMAADVGDQYEAFTLDEEVAVTKAEMVYADVGQKGVSVIYKIQRPATVKSDGSESKFPITTQMLKANFEYSTYPRASVYAYLGSRVTNAKNLQLLAGQVNLFLEGEFVGKSSIDNIGPGQDFDLYLGIDENVKVKREEIEKKVDDVLIAGIASPNKTTTFKYKLSVENNTTKAINVILFEAMPVSENERIKVKVFNVKVKPKKKNWKDRKGVWRWEFKLEPNQKKEIFYSFSVEHPRKMNVSGI